MKSGKFMDKDMLSILEERWAAMANAITRLRGDNGALQEKVNDYETLCAAQEDQLTEVRKEAEELQSLCASQESQLLELGKDLVELREEKSRTISRIESLLARFNDLES